MLGSQIPLVDIRNAVLVLLLITAVLATIFYRKYRHSALKYFLILIWYNVATEYFAPYYSEYFSYNNVILFNIYRVVEFTFYFILYHNLVVSYKHKLTIRIFLGLYYISFITNYFVEDIVTEYFAKSFFVGASLIILSIIIYFSEILNSEKIININRMFSFWISIAVFLSYVTTIPFKFILNYNQDSPTIPYIYAGNYAVVFIFYLLIIIGLFWSKEE